MNLSEISIKRPVFPLMITIALCIFGYTALTSMPLDLMPEIDFPIITIQTLYPGADADTVENDVSDKIEEAVSVVSGIKILKSTSYENISVLMIQFDSGEDVNEKTQECRDKISAIRLMLPTDIEEPVIGKFNINELPVLSIVVSGPESIAKVTEFTEDIAKNRLQQVTGVGSINRIGGRERKIRIWLDPVNLKAKNVAALEVAQALASKNLDVPGGTLTQGSTDFVVKTKGRIKKVKDFENIIIAYSAGAPIFLRDVATVQDGLEDEDSISRLDGDSAVSLQIIKQSGGNSVAISDEVKKAIVELEKIAPPGYKIQITQNLTDFIQVAIHGAEEDVMYGIVLTVIVILLFLANGRMTIVTAIAIPTSLLATLATISFFGYTQNMITVMAVALTVGIVVDDTIVMVENIHRHLEMGKSRMKAAISGAKEITFAILAASFSLMAVFLPLSMMTGIVGEFFTPFGITVGVAIFWSMIVSLILSPMLSSRLVSYTKNADGKPKGLYARFSNGILTGFEKAYKSVLGFALKARLLIIIIAIGVFIGGAYVASKLKVEFEPMMDQSEFSVNIEAPQGTTLEKTSELTENIENIIREMPLTKFVYSTIGGGALSEAQKASIYVKLVPTKMRPNISQVEIMKELRILLDKVNENLKPAEKLIISVEEATMVAGMSSKPVQFSVRGPDFKVLDRITTKIEAEIRKIPGFIDIDRTYKVGKPEALLVINREKAAELGVPISYLAMTIRQCIAGEEVTKFKDGPKEYDVIMKLGSDYRDSVNKLSNLHVRSAKGELIQMSNLVKLEKAEGMSQINRFSRQREIVIMTNLEGLILGDAMAAIDKIVATKVKMPSGYQASHEGMARNQMESFGEILNALGLSFLIVYIVLAIQFNSFIHPITILMTVPLAFVGGFIALYLFDQTMNIFSMVGLVLLVGIVTKNGILLIDFIMKFREKGLSRRDAILKAGPIRLRPILMTAFSTIAGMLPLAMMLSDGAEMRAPMAFVIIGGLVTSTILTLLVIPVVYTFFDDIANNRLFKGFLGLIIPKETGKIDDSKVYDRMLLDEFNALSADSDKSKKDTLKIEEAKKRVTDKLLQSQGVNTAKPNGESFKIIQNSEVIKKLDDAADKLKTQPDTATDLEFDSELVEIHEAQNRKKEQVDITQELTDLPDLRESEDDKEETKRVKKVAAPEPDKSVEPEKSTQTQKPSNQTDFTRVFNELIAENPDKFSDLISKVQELQNVENPNGFMDFSKRNNDAAKDLSNQLTKPLPTSHVETQKDILSEDPVVSKTSKVFEVKKPIEKATIRDSKLESKPPVKKDNNVPKKDKIMPEKKDVQKPSIFTTQKPKEDAKTENKPKTKPQVDSQAVIFPPPNNQKPDDNQNSDLKKPENGKS